VARVPGRNSDTPLAEAQKSGPVLRQIDFGVCVGHFDLLNRLSFAKR
jgi:hypothetical protein